MFGIAGLGFLLGMQHALEADHIAAVSSIAARRAHLGEIVNLGPWAHHHLVRLCRRGDVARPGHTGKFGAADRSRGWAYARGARRARALAVVARPGAFSRPRAWRRHGAHPYP